jgi:hypothetical protein
VGILEIRAPSRLTSRKFPSFGRARKNSKVAKGEKMPRGSKPGERRGGRQRGTPNKKTLLKNAVFLAAAADPNRSPLDFMLALMRDSQVPLDLRIDAAAASASLVHARPKAPRDRRPHPMEIRRRRAKAAIGDAAESAHSGGEPKSAGLDGGPSTGSGVQEKPAGGNGGEKQVVAGEGKTQANLSTIASQAVRGCDFSGGDCSRLDPLSFLLGVMHDEAATPRERFKAARIAARYQHKPPARPVHLVEDEFGFKIDPAVAKAVAAIKAGCGTAAPANTADARSGDARLRDDIDTIKCPDCYGSLDLLRDEARLKQFWAGRGPRAKLRPEEAAERDYLMTRTEVYRASGRHHAWCRMAQLGHYRALGYTLSDGQRAELERLRAQFPTVAQQVDGIDLSGGTMWLWLEIYHKLKDAKKRGVELSAAQARQEVLEPIRQNLALKRQIIDDKDDKGDIEGIERWLARLRAEMDKKPDFKAHIDRQEQEETAQRQRRAG